MGTEVYLEWLRRQSRAQEKREKRRMPGWIWILLAAALAVFILKTM